MHYRVAPGFVSEAAVIPRETIAAISTAAGEGAVALVRVSGESAIQVAEAVYRGAKPASELRSHTQHVGEIVTSGSAVDQVMLSVHRSPSSYTGEDLVEISCHGGMLVTARVLEACLQAGARAARPGEFTERAYMNGKIDITQAEAVIDVIRAQTDLALRSATEQLAGRLGEQFRTLRQELIDILAHVEAAIEFPEEGISPDSLLTIGRRLRVLRGKMDQLLATAETGRILRDGLRVVIFGPTNAGKSSLLNRLLGFDRAIVSETHGTTRDTIEEQMSLRGIPVRLLDTAGLRSPENPVEEEGIARTQRSLESADLRLHVVDASGPQPAHFHSNGNDLLLLNKTDLAEHRDWNSVEALRISCKTGTGLPKLEDVIFRRIGAAKLDSEHPLAINARHRHHLRHAAEACDRARAAIESGATAEIPATLLSDARGQFDQLLSGGDEEAVRNAIFSQFCIGK
jgi:tRNA modification GTPase TrmE